MPVLNVADHAYFLQSQDSPVDPPYLPESGTGLVASTEATVMIVTGTDTGPVTVDVQVLQAPPRADSWPLAGWDEVAEVSVTAVNGLNVCGSDIAPYPEIDPIPLEGPVRIRVHARGRDAANEGPTVLTEPVEEHLLLLWAAPPADNVLLVGSDVFGTIWGRSE